MSAAPPSLQVEISYRQIIRIALPISLAMLVPQLNFITNNIFLGHHSPTSLALAAITGVYYLIFAAIGYGLNNGLQALIARRAGENRPEEIGRIFHQGILVAMGIAAIGILLTWFITPVVLRSVIRDQSTVADYTHFLRIRIWGLPFLYIYQLRNALLVGTNQSKYLIIGTLAETVTNILLDYLLIFGKWGFPELGFNGAAVASVIAEFTGMFVIYLVIRKKGISQRFGLFKKFGMDTVRLKQVLSMSAPLIFQHAISIMSWWFFYLLIERNTNQMDLGISNTMRNLFGLFGVVSWAFAATSNAMVSNIIGQGKKDQVISLINRIIHLSSGFALFVFVLLNLFPITFISMFGQDTRFAVESIPVIRVVSTAMLLMSIGTVWLNAVTATGNSRITFLIEFVAIVLYCTYVYLVMEVYQLSLSIGWMSEWLYWTSLFTLSFFYIRSGKWKSKKL
ncbi:MAG: MATE family efflux transporter [Chitinophagaceae bacterium]|nr:MATE family efflux transporter [Chitinophagaceae bacterium]